MENSTLAFFIGVQNLCIAHNKAITSAQWMLGNLFVFISVASAIWFFHAARKGTSINRLRRGMTAYFLALLLFFVAYNAVSLSLPIDEREAMEEVLEEKPELAESVRQQLHNLKRLGSELQ